MNPGTCGATRSSTISVGFVRADSSNLPHMDECMILEYMACSSNYNIAEIRGAKALMSSRDSYLESAVGYVELQRIVADECIVKAKVTPEHRIANKNYITTVTVNEKTNVIKEAECDSCAASAGGCKHSLVFLFWLSKRSTEPSPTSVQCYWKKPKLASIRSQPMEAENIFKNVKKIKLLDKNLNILSKFKEESKKHNTKNSLISLFLGEKRLSYNLFDMTLDYVHNEQNFDFKKYKEDLDKLITPNVIKKNCEETMLQANSKMWHYIRQGRITASKIYDASQCNVDGSLVQQILGGYKVPQAKAIQRGQKLEKEVLKEVEKNLNKKIGESGFILINSLVGASPDGVGPDFIVEVKCPITEKNMKNYVSDNKIKKKFAAQMQIQMLAANKNKGLFCLADPSFETNRRIHIYWLLYDPIYAKNLVENATNFWEKFIYEKILKSAM